MSKNIVTEVSDSDVRTGLSPFGIEPSSEEVLKIKTYISLLLKWNKVISLTTVTNPREIVSRHFGESMYAVSLIPTDVSRLADVGTGAGFPGLAIKILRPNLHITLIESNKKKTAFLAEVSRSLDLLGVRIEGSRFEELAVEKDAFDVITARALGGFADFLRWAPRSLNNQGQLMLWVGSDDASQIARVAGWKWDPLTRIPDSERRYILTGHLGS